MDQKPEHKIKAFVSYKRLDKDFVKRLNDDLAKEGIDVWVDWADIPTGEDWRNEIAVGIQNSHAFVLVISPDSVVSREVGYEIEMAIKNKKRILPIMYRDEEGIWNRIPAGLGKINAVNMRNDEEYQQNLSSLLQAMRVDFQHIRKHTKIQNRAIDWEKGGKRTSSLLHGDDLQQVEAWMVEAIGKEPPPTELQAEYVRASRADETRRQRLTLFSVSIGLAVAVILGILALYQWNQADIARRAAIDNLNRARSAEADAKIKQSLAEQNAEIARQNEEEATFQRDRALKAEEDATTQRDRALVAEQDAIQQRDLAVQQQLLAFARRLGAEGLTALQSSEIERSLLLSISSLDTVSNPQADLALRTGLDLLPRNIAVLTGNTAIGSGVTTGGEGGGDSGSLGIGMVTNTNPAVYSPDGSQLFTSNGENGISIWNTAKYLRPTTLDQGSPVIALAQHPSEPWLAAAGADGSLRIWDTTTGEVVQTFANPSPVVLLAFNPAGTTLVSAGRDNVVRTWSIRTGEELYTIVHRAAVTGIAFSRAGTYMATSSLDGRIFFYDASTKSSRLTFTGSSGFTTIAFHPTNLVLLSGNEQGLAQAWDLTNGREFRRLSHETAITRVLISPDTSMYVTASEDNTIRVWSVATGQILKTLAHNAPVRDIAVDATSRYLASTSDDGTVRIWDIQRGLEIARSPILAHQVIFSPTNTDVAVMTVNGKINVFDYTSAQQALRTLALDDQPTGLAAGTRAGNPVAVVAAGSTVTLWNFGTDGVQSAFQVGGGVLDVALDSKDGRLATADALGRVCLWAMDTGEKINCVTLGGQIHDVDFSPDGAWLVASGAQASVIDAATGEILYTIDLPEGGPVGTYITAVALDEDGKRLALATSADPSVHFYDLESGELIFQTTAQFGLADPANLVEYIPTQDWLVTSQGQNIFVWDAATGNLLQRFFNTSEIYAMAVSVDGDKLAIAGEDFNAYVWDLQTGSEVARIPSAGLVLALVFNSDGTRLLTTSDDGLVQISSLQRDNLVSEACRRLTRNLSFAEWMLYIGGDTPYYRTCDSLPFGDGVRDALISLALDQVLAGNSQDAETTLAILAGEDGVQEQFKAALAKQVEAEMINNHLGDALTLSEYMSTRLASPALLPVTGGSTAETANPDAELAAVIAQVCQAAASGQPERALAVCDYAINMDSEDYRIYEARAEARARTGDLSGAITDLEIAQALDSSNAARKTERQAQIDALKAGENPYTTP